MTTPTTTPPTAPDKGTRLARPRYTFRLPLDLAARLEALCEMHPDKTRSQLMTDLLGLGLAQVDHASSRSGSCPPPYQPDTRQPVYLLTGPFSEFHGLTCKHHLAMERELAREDLEGLYAVDDYDLGDSA